MQSDNFFSNQKKTKNMKKFGLLFLIAIFGVSTISLNSCKKDDDDDITPPSLAPVIEITAPNWPTGQGDVSSDIPVNISFTAKSNPNTNKDLEEITVTVRFSTGGDTTIYDEIVPNNESKYKVVNLVWNVPQSAPHGSTQTLTITVTDKSNAKGTKQLIMKVIDNTNMSTFENIELASWTNAAPYSFLDPRTGKKYNIDEARLSTTIQRSIDIVYYFGTANAASIAAPSVERFDNGSGSDYITSLQVFQWGTRNATTFRKLGVDFDDAAWDALTHGSVIKQKYNTATGAVSDEIISMSDGALGQTRSYVAFRTIYDRGQVMGILRVDNITYEATNSSNKMTVSIKIMNEYK
jgi:hypothetical protein